MTYAKKSYGQHFLTSESIAEKIADAMQPFGQIDSLVEVGPGKGMLTKYLTGQYKNLYLVEADDDMVGILKHDTKFNEAHIIAQDYLRLDLHKLRQGNPIYIIGNFPYNISSQIVIKMIDHRDIIPGMVGMFQKEMAERIAHAPGSREYGVISVLTQAYYDVEYLFTVKEGNFNPPPKVKSGVLRFTRKEKLKLDCDEVEFKKIMKACFLQKRKMIRNSLKPFLSAEKLQDSFFDKRPEELSVDDFVRITNMANPVVGAAVADQDIKKEQNNQ